MESKEVIKKVRAMWFPPYDGLHLELESGEELFLIDKETWDTIKGKI